MSKLEGNCKLLSVRKPSSSQWDNFPTQKASREGLESGDSIMVVKFCTSNSPQFTSLTSGRGCIYQSGEELILITVDRTKHWNSAASNKLVGHPHTNTNIYKYKYIFVHTNTNTNRYLYKHKYKQIFVQTQIQICTNTKTMQVQIQLTGQSSSFCQKFWPPQGGSS